jgi:hypothetical protein
MEHVPNVLGEGGEGPAHVEEGERQGDHVHLLHGVGARARDISLNTKHTFSILGSLSQVRIFVEFYHNTCMYNAHCTSIQKCTGTVVFYQCY